MTPGNGSALHPASGWPDGWYALECDQCRATWVGPEGEPCQWCERRIAAQDEHQRELDLRPPDVADGDDVAEAAAAWLRRLQVAVAAGRVNPDRAAAVVARWIERNEAA